MRISTQIALGAALLATLGFGASAANAQAQFGSFTNASLNNFNYSNGTNLFVSGGGAAATGIPVSFQFTSALGGVPAFTPIAATLTFSATGAPTGVNASFALPLTGVTMSITRNSDSANLLSITSSTGRLGSANAGNTGASNSNAIPASGDTFLGDTVTFTSAFINFAPSNQRVYSFTTSDANPNYTIGAGNKPTSFAATYSGSFSNAAVPEANAGALALLALPLLGGVAVLRRRTAK